MIKLSKGQIEKLLPRYTGQTPLELQFALELQYAYHGENGFGPYKCPVFADDAENPNILLLGTDWVHLWGDASYGKSDDALFEWIAKQRARLPAKKDMVLNLYSLGWETKLENRFSDLVKERGFRLNHRLNREAFAQHAGWRERIPAGFEVRYFALKRNRFAFRVMKGEECVSACTVVY
ncbi:MAG: hypothetical protein FWE98_07180, partial [Oscillospiraceae bacterium]|nr:hypothetical protein [Oscillospiraceae bacterium]